MRSQSVKLLRHLLDGGSISRESAWRDFGIQNITARLSELRQLGFRFLKTKTTAYMTGCPKMKTTSWKLTNGRLKKDAWVKVTDDVYPITVLKGRIGEIAEIHYEDVQATVYFRDCGYRRVPLVALEVLSSMPRSTPVRIKEGPLVVLEYYPDSDSYLLASSHPDHTVVASAALVVARNA